MTPDDLLTLPMTELKQRYPSMKRALFSAFHIGGCQSCAYGEDETLASVCERNELAPAAVAAEILESAERDAAMMLSPQEAQSLLQSAEPPLLLDTRTREEYEAVKITGAVLLTQEFQNSLFKPENEQRTILLYDHTGLNALDTCSWFHGHGLKGTRIIAGGIDRWAQEVEENMPRYRVELD